MNTNRIHPLIRFDGKTTREVSLHNYYKGQDAYLCASGPSLKDVDPSDLNAPGCLVVGINGTYPYIKPHIWVGADDPKCFQPKLYRESFLKIMRAGYEDRTTLALNKYTGSRGGQAIKYSPNLMFVVNNKVSGHWTTRIPAEITYLLDTGTKMPIKGMKMLWGGNVITLTIHILVYLGIRRIHLLGSDLSSDKGHHFREDYEYPSLETHAEFNEFIIKNNTALHKHLINWYRELNKQSGKFGVEIISCTPGSPLNDFLNYIPLKKALDITGSNTPEDTFTPNGVLVESFKKKYGRGWWKCLEESIDRPELIDAFEKPKRHGN